MDFISKTSFAAHVKAVQELTKAVGERLKEHRKMLELLTERMNRVEAQTMQNRPAPDRAKEAMQEYIDNLEAAVAQLQSRIHSNDK